MEKNKAGKGNEHAGWLGKAFSGEVPVHRDQREGQALIWELPVGKRGREIGLQGVNGAGVGKSRSWQWVRRT